MSGSRYTNEEVRRQVAALPDDLPRLAHAAELGAAQAATRFGPFGRVVLLGSGDSLHAALAAQPMFDVLGVENRAMSASEFRRHGAWLDGVSLLVGISASGGNPTVLEAVAAAAERGLPTLAVTSAAEGRLAAACPASIVVDPGPCAPSPGIRTYQASLLALLHLARAGYLAGAEAAAAERAPADAVTGGDVSAHLAGLIDVDAIACAQRHAIDATEKVAAQVAGLLAAAPVILVVSDGSLAGTARHIAAKLSETAGVPAVAVELEDWWHVHRFGHDDRHPVLFLVAPGAARDAALAVARRTAQRRRLIVVAGADDHEVRSLGIADMPVPDNIAATVRPLVDATIAGLLAAELASLLGRLPFSRQ